MKTVAWVAVVLLAAAPAAAQDTGARDRAHALNIETVRALEAHRPAQARALAEQAIALLAPLSAQHPLDLANALNNLGIALKHLRKYPEALETLQKALALREGALPETDPAIAESLNNIATLHIERGQPIEALPLWHRALGIHRKGGDSVEMVGTLSNLAQLYAAIGNTLEGEVLYREALHMLKRLGKGDDPLFATVTSGLGVLLRDRYDYAGAEKLFRQALALQDKPGGDPVDIGVTLHNLGSLVGKRRKRTDAEALLGRAIALFESALTPDHPYRASALSALGIVLARQDRYQEAEASLLKALEIYGRLQGYREGLAEVLNNLVMVLWAQGEIEDALRFQQLASLERERGLADVMRMGTTATKRTHLNAQRAELDEMISLHLHGAPTSQSAAATALSALLQWKGRALDATASAFQELRAHGDPRIPDILARSSTARRTLAALALRRVSGNAATRKALIELRRDLYLNVEATERALSQLHGASSQPPPPATAERVAKTLADGTALVEVAMYWPIDPRAPDDTGSDDARYVAYVLRANGAITAVDLGPIGPMDALALRTRREFGAVRRSYRTAARQLYAKLVQPLEPLLSGVAEVYFSPDSTLNAVPIGALIDDRDRFLAARFRFTYLTSGRDLLRLAQRAEPQSGPAVYAAPDYDAPAIAPERKPGTSVLPRLQLQDGMRREGERVAAVLGLAPSALRMAAAADEHSLASLAGPSLLHLATHGFFLDERSDTGSPRRGVKFVPSRAKVAPVDLYDISSNPLVRSGIVLAGVHARAGEVDDGVVTAYEFAAMDLRGTQLVTLSACDTGLGHASVGEGVYGLRRALVLAGAESQLTSLWQVPDAETGELMADYYQRLRAGEGRSEALRQAQLARMDHHPFYWAAFVLSGDPGPMHGEWLGKKK